MKKMVVLVCQHLILSILLLSTSTYGLPPPAEEGSSSNNALNNISFQFNVNDGNAAREDFFGEGWAKEERNDADDVDSGREDAALPSPITVTTSVTRIEYVRVTREAVAGGVEGVVAGAADDASERPSPFSPASNQEAVDVVDDEPETRPESRADEVLPGSGDLEPGTSSPITAEDEVTDPQDSAGRQPVFNPYAVPDTPEEKFEIEKSYNIIVSNKIGLRDEMCPICMAAVPLRGMTFTNDQQSEMYSLLQRGLTKWNGFESIRKELVSCRGSFIISRQKGGFAHEGSLIDYKICSRSNLHCG